MLLREVLYFLGLKTNLVSISGIEERGYEVLFHDGKVILDLRAAGILDLIHLDVCGPMYSTSLTSCLYYVIFIDEFS
jgi:hypothetical protein